MELLGLIGTETRGAGYTKQSAQQQPSIKRKIKNKKSGRKTSMHNVMCIQDHIVSKIEKILFISYFIDNF